MHILFSVSLFWAFSFGLIKTRLSNVDPLLISFLRILISTAIFLPFLSLKKVQKPGHLMVIGLLQLGLMYFFYLHSFKFLKAHEVALLTITTPVFIVLIGSIANRNFKWNYLWASILALLSGFVLVKNKSIQGSFFGVLLVQLSNFVFALGQVIYKNISKDYVNNFSWFFLGALIPSFLGWVLFTDRSIQLNQSELLTILYLGAVPSALGFYLWNKGIQLVSIPVTAVFNNLKIPLAVLVSSIFFEESIHLTNLILSIAIFYFAFRLSKKS